MENKLQTAEEFLQTKPDEGYSFNETVRPYLIEFGKMCARYALEQAAEKATLISDHQRCEISTSSILNAFDVEEIK